MSNVQIVTYYMFAFEMLDFATYFPPKVLYRPSLPIVYIVTSSPALIPSLNLNGCLHYITTQQQPRPPLPALPSNAISGYTLTTCSL